MRAALAGLISLIIGLGIGWLGASAVSSASYTFDAAASDPGPSGKSAGVGIGFSRTREGAVLAAGSYQRAFADKAVLRPGELRRRIKTVATPDFAGRMLKASESGLARLARGSFGQGVRAGLPSAFLGVPVSFRLLSFAPSRAVVQVWGFSLIGNAGEIVPTAFFGLSRTELVWREGDWKIAATRASFGPTPRLGSPRPGGEGLGLVELATELRPYGLAP